MRQLTFEEIGRYVWREVDSPEITGPEQALVRPVAVACCDLDVAVVQGRVPMPPGHAVGHEGLAEVVAIGHGVRTVDVGERVVVPFQISCGSCGPCRRGVTGSCASLPLMAMYGMAPIAGLDGGGFMSDLLLVPYADAMLIPAPKTVDPLAIASLSDNIPDGWRAVGPLLLSWPASMRWSDAFSWWAGVDRIVCGGIRFRAGRARRLCGYRPNAACRCGKTRRHIARSADAG